MEDSKPEDVGDGTGTFYYIKLGGLPWKASEEEIGEFLVGCEVAENVEIIYNEAGKPSGDAVVKLSSKKDLERALSYKNKSLLERYVNVEEINEETYKTLSKKLEKVDGEENAFIMLRGLVWTATEKDIKTFLHDCKVKEVVITLNEGGKPSGNAYIHLESEEDVEKAKAHNRQYLGKRFVIVEEIYESQYARETKTVGLHNETKKVFSKTELRLSNLPLTSNEKDIQSFLKDCKYKQIRILKTKAGKPSGEAIVETESSDDLVRGLICNNSTLDGRPIAVDRVETDVIGKVSQTSIEIGKKQEVQSKIGKQNCLVKNKDETETKFCIQLSGLPWKATAENIMEFLVDCEVVGDVIIILNEAGKPSGDAVVKLLNEDNLEKALKCNRTYLQDRFIIIEETTIETYNKHARKTEKFDGEENVYIQLRGLVWSATEDDIKTFLHDCNVKEVVLTTNSGKPSGNAFVHLESENDVEKAKAHNKQYLRERFVLIEEIYESKYLTEKQQAKSEENKDEIPKKEIKENKKAVESKNVYVKDKKGIHASNFCIKLSGLPWKATSENITEFLVDCEIVGDVIIINNEAGKPSGDAVVKLLNEDDLEKALKCNRTYLQERFIIIEETNMDTYNKHIRKTEKLDGEENVYIQLRGLVWSATEEDIKAFLHDCNVKEVVLTTKNGKPSGNAFVHLDSEDDVEKAKAHNKQFLRERFVIVEEIYEAQYLREIQEAKADENADEIQREEINDIKGNIIRLKGLPSDATEVDIVEFLVDCEIVGKVIRIVNEAGRVTGDAIVKMLNKEDVERALQYNRKYLGERYIIIELSDIDTFNRHITKAEKIEDEENVFIRLRGLVWSATEDDVKTFLHDCNVKEVVITTNRRGKPSGNAFVHLENEEDVDKAKAHNKEHLRERFVVVDEIFKSQYLRETQGFDQKNTTKQNKIEHVNDVEPMEVESKEKSNSEDEIVVKKAFFRFDICPIESTDIEEVMEDCKDVCIEGVIWHMGDIILDSKKRQRIRLGCTVANTLNVDIIKEKLEALDSVENVEIN